MKCLLFFQKRKSPKQAPYEASDGEKAEKGAGTDFCQITV